MTTVIQTDPRIEKYKNVTDLRQYDRKWKVTNDGTNSGERIEEIWEQCIQGKYGQIYPNTFDGGLAVCITSPKVMPKIAALLGCGVPEHSTGDEHLFKFKHTPELVNGIAVIIRARRSRKGRMPSHIPTPEQRAKGLAALAAARAKKKALASLDSKPALKSQNVTSGV